MFLNRFIVRNFVVRYLFPQVTFAEVLPPARRNSVRYRSVIIGDVTDRVLKLFFGWNNVLENVQNPPSPKIRS